MHTGRPTPFLSQIHEGAKKFPGLLNCGLFLGGWHGVVLTLESLWLLLSLLFCFLVFETKGISSSLFKNYWFFSPNHLCFILDLFFAFCPTTPKCSSPLYEKAGSASLDFRIFLSDLNLLLFCCRPEEENQLLNKSEWKRRVKFIKKKQPY